MSSKLKTRVRKMNFQRQGNERNFETSGNHEETKYYDKLYIDRTRFFLKKTKKNTWHLIFFKVEYLF
jgi:hypothetical protein